MFTVVETLLFQRQWPLYWTEEQWGEFASFIAEHPTAGDVVPESGGIRKVRWSRAGSGILAASGLSISLVMPKERLSC